MIGHGPEELPGIRGGESDHVARDPMSLSVDNGGRSSGRGAAVGDDGAGADLHGHVAGVPTVWVRVACPAAAPSVAVIVGVPTVVDEVMVTV
jgi:hypothetical protein